MGILLHAINEGGFMDFLVPIGVALAFFLLCWLYGLAIRQGRPFTPFMRKTLICAPIFILGVGYLMMFAGNLHWSSALLFVLIAGWGAAVFLAALCFYRRQNNPRRSRMPISNH